MKILITGHKGFIGSYVFDFLQDKFKSSLIEGVDFPDDIQRF